MHAALSLALLLMNFDFVILVSWFSSKYRVPI